VNVKPKICAFVATLGPIGSLPMPEIWGMFAAVPLLFAMHRFTEILGISNYRFQRLTIIVLICIAWWIIEQSLLVIRDRESSKILLDEVIGVFVTMSSVPFNVMTILVGLGYFRIMKTFKPFGVAYAATMPGAMGILLDDIIAGIWAYIAMMFTFQIMGLPLF